MKRILFAGLLVAALFTVSPIIAQVDTNSVATNAPSGTLHETFKPITDLLGGKGTWLTTLLTWLGAIGLVLAPFSVWIQHKLADALDDAAASADEDDDSYLRKLFSNPVYRFGAFALRFVNIKLPTLADLERALKLKAEAVSAAKQTGG